MLKTQGKSTINRGILHTFCLIWDCETAIDPGRLIWDYEPAIDPEICEIKEDVLSWV